MEHVKCPTPNTVLSIEHLHKEFHHKTVINDFNYSFKRGRIYLLTDMNGYGKSTLLKIICGFIKGEGHANFYAEHISYVPEKINLPTLMKSYDYLDILGEIKGLNKKTRQERIDQLAKHFDFLDGLNKPIKELSKGMKQKVLLIGAFLREDDVYIFDEVLNGLDEASVNHLLELIKERKKQATFIIVSHEKTLYEGLYDEIVHLA